MKAILIYGPPSSGKGTHSRLLSEAYSLPFIEAGNEFRNYAKKITPLGIYLARRLSQGKPIPSWLYTLILKNKLKRYINQRQDFIFDKPGGSLLGEVRWFFKILPVHVTVYLFVLHIPLTESIRRATTRFFVPHSGQSFMTYEEAMESCNENEHPIQRNDDSKAFIVKERYTKLYANTREAILSHFRSHKAIVTELDATKEIATVQNEIRSVLDKSYEQNT